MAREDTLDLGVGAMRERPDHAAEVGQVGDEDEAPAGPAMGSYHGDAEDGDADGRAGAADGDAVGYFPPCVVLYASQCEGGG